MVKEIDLTRSQVAIVDDDVPEWLLAMTWRPLARGKNVYAATVHAGKKELLHRMVAGVAPGVYLRFLNGDTLDCRRENIAPKKGTERVTGRIIHICGEEWAVWATIDRNYRRIGTFYSKEAAQAALKSAIMTARGIIQKRERVRTRELATKALGDAMEESGRNIQDGRCGHNE